jgi:hypothetical protein
LDLARDMSEEIPLPLAQMRKFKRIKAGVKHARKTAKGHKKKVHARKKKATNKVAKTHIDLNQPGALTHLSVARLTASASDKTRTQLQVTKFGVVSISSERIGGGVDEDLAFCLESWSPGTDYVGPKAAQDDHWVKCIYKVLRENWPVPSSSYIDIF